MKTTDQTSARITTKSPAPRWYRVRPALGWTLALSVAAWLGVIGEGVAHLLGNQEFLDTVARVASQNASAVLNVLAVGSVAAVFVERARTTGGLSKMRRRLVRSMRVAHGSRTARA